MHGHRRLGSVLPIVLCLAGAALVATVPAQSQTAAEVSSPHGVLGEGETCVSCHPVHAQDNAPGMLAAGQRELCYSCHDGSTTAHDVKSEFGTEANPQAASHPLGGGLTCGDCHTAHKDPSEDTRLLRAFIDGTWVYSPPSALGTPIGNDFCYSCHGPGSALPAPNGDHSTFETSIHNTSAGVPMPKSGSEIKCLSCHEPHGSNERKLTLDDLPEEELCYSCHTADTPNTSGGPAPIAPSNPFVAFTGTSNDYLQDSSGPEAGIRMFHHPVGTADQAGATRQVECVSCHNTHLADATSGKLVNPANVNQKFIVQWTPGSYGQRGNINAFCATCHISPTTTEPLTATSDGSVPFTVRMVNDTGPMYDNSSNPAQATHAHDNFTYPYWLNSDESHGPKGANLACTACHDFHGTSNAFMLKETVISVGPETTPGSTSTVTDWQAVGSVAGDGAKIQAFCSTCHGSTHNTGQECTRCHYHGNSSAKW
jgi:predicted CXXCH cytochrome family protein